MRCMKRQFSRLRAWRHLTFTVHFPRIKTRGYFCLTPTEGYYNRTPTEFLSFPLLTCGICIVILSFMSFYSPYYNQTLPEFSNSFLSCSSALKPNFIQLLLSCLQFLFSFLSVVKHTYYFNSKTRIIFLSKSSA